VIQLLASRRCLPLWQAVRKPGPWLAFLSIGALWVALVCGEGSGGDQSEKLSHVLAEYEKATPDMRAASDRVPLYRSWMERFAKAVDAGGSEQEVRKGRTILLSLANACGDYGLSRKMADTLAASAQSDGDQVFWRVEAAEIAYLSWVGAGRPHEQAEAVIDTLASARTLASERQLLTGAIAERYITEGYHLAKVLEAGRGDHLAAARVYVETEVAFRTSTTDEQRKRLAQLRYDSETLLGEAVIAYARGKDRKTAEQLFERLEALPAHREPLGQHWLRMVRAESPEGGQGFQARLSEWLAAHPKDVARRELLFELGRDQMQHGSDADAVGTFSTLIDELQRDASGNGETAGYLREAWFQTAILWRRLGDWQASAAATEQFARLTDPDDRRAAILRSWGVSTRPVTTAPGSALPAIRPGGRQAIIMIPAPATRPAASTESR
jgi:hypothetical protein